MTMIMSTKGTWQSAVARLLLSRSKPVERSALRQMIPEMGSVTNYAKLGRDGCKGSAASRALQDLLREWQHLDFCSREGNMVRVIDRAGLWRWVADRDES